MAAVKKIIMICYCLSSTGFLCAMESLDAQIEVLRDQQREINEQIAKKFGNSTMAYRFATKYSTPDIDDTIKRLERAKEKMKSKL